MENRINIIKAKEGEIATILALGAMLLLGTATVLSSLFIKSSNSYKSKAAPSCHLKADFDVRDEGGKKAFYSYVTYSVPGGGQVTLTYNGVFVAGPNDVNGDTFTYDPQWTQPYRHDADVAVMTVGEGDYPFTYTGTFSQCGAITLNCSLGVKDGKPYVNGDNCVLKGGNNTGTQTATQTESNTSKSDSQPNLCQVSEKKKTGGSPPGVIKGGSKNNIAEYGGGCDPACCEFNGQCPSGQACNIGNGGCQSGFSCGEAVQSSSSTTTSGGARSQESRTVAQQTQPQLTSTPVPAPTKKVEAPKTTEKGNIEQGICTYPAQECNNPGISSTYNECDGDGWFNRSCQNNQICIQTTTGESNSGDPNNVPRISCVDPTSTGKQESIDPTSPAVNKICDLNLDKKSLNCGPYGSIDLSSVNLPNIDMGDLGQRVKDLFTSISSGANWIQLWNNSKNTLINSLGKIGFYFDSSGGCSLDVKNNQLTIETLNFDCNQLDNIQTNINDIKTQLSSIQTQYTCGKNNNGVCYSPNEIDNSSNRQNYTAINATCPQGNQCYKYTTSETKCDNKDGQGWTCEGNKKRFSVQSINSSVKYYEGTSCNNLEISNIYDYCKAEVTQSGYSGESATCSFKGENYTSGQTVCKDSTILSKCNGTGDWGDDYNCSQIDKICGKEGDSYGCIPPPQTGMCLDDHSPQNRRNTGCPATYEKSCQTFLFQSGVRFFSVGCPTNPKNNSCIVKCKSAEDLRNNTGQYSETACTQNSTCIVNELINVKIKTNLSDSCLGWEKGNAPNYEVVGEGIYEYKDDGTGHNPKLAWYGRTLDTRSSNYENNFKLSNNNKGKNIYALLMLKRRADGVYYYAPSNTQPLDGDLTLEVSYECPK